MTILTASRMGPAVGRRVGTAAGGALALALLACGCVFTALAGPAFSLHIRTEALHQILGALPGTTRTIQVSTAWTDFTQSLPDPTGLTQSELTEATGEIGSSLAAQPLPLGAGQWVSLTSKPLTVAGGAAKTAYAAAPPQLEVSYRAPAAGYVQVVKGSLAGGGPGGAVAVMVTGPTAARFGLHPGSVLDLSTLGPRARLYVSAIVRVRHPGSTWWQQDTTPIQPTLTQQQPSSPAYWLGGVIADPDQLGSAQQVFGPGGLELQWEYPLDISRVNADQAQNLYQALNRATTATPALTYELAPAEDALVVTSPLLPELAQFLANQAAVETVLLLLFVSLIVVGTAVILLAGRMIVARRETELSLLRARGGSLSQVAARVLAGTAVAAGPGIIVGAGIALALPGGGSGPGGWPLTLIAAVAALADAPLIAVWQHRRPAPVSNPAQITTAEIRRSRGPGRPWRRLVTEVTAIAAAVAGLVVLHDQGVPAPSGGSGTPGTATAASSANLTLTVVPILIAVPVVVIMLRLYPLAVRGLAALAARRPGATGFVALSRAARSPLNAALPAFALVLTLTLATFAGMISQSITSGEITASWQATGADVLITPGPASPAVSPAAVKAIAAVPGVRHATEAWNTGWFTPFGQPITVSAVDPASYAAVTAGTPFTPFPAQLIGKAAPATPLPDGAVVPVLASPSAAAILGTAPVQLSTLGAIGPLKVRVAGIIKSTPALPGGGDFVVMALRTLAGPTGAPSPNILLATGSAIDHARLIAAADHAIPGNATTFRSQVLTSLNSSPLQHGAGLIITLTIAAAAGLGLLVVILGLALGSAERGMTLARLTVMGHERRPAWSSPRPCRPCSSRWRRESPAPCCCPPRSGRPSTCPRSPAPAPRSSSRRTPSRSGCPPPPSWCSR